MKKLKYQNRYWKQTFKLKATLNGKKTEKQKTIDLEDTLDVDLADKQAVNYNGDTSLDDLETVDYNNDTIMLL